MSQHRVSTGPLGPYVDGFCDHLAQLGYSESTQIRDRSFVRGLGQWLAAEGLGETDLHRATFDRYWRHQRSTGRVVCPTGAVFVPLLSYLAERGVVQRKPASAELSAQEQLCHRFRDYLLTERGLTSLSAHRAVGVARAFLTHRDHQTDGPVAAMTAAEVLAFLRHERARLSVRSTARTASALRTFLRYLHVAGLTSTSLAQSLPRVAGWRHADLPRALGSGDVERLLATCDRSRRAGRRDNAIITVLARTGIRAGELVALRLDDVDWRSGQLTIRGKGNRREQLPLPADVGTAMSDYLRHGRPTTDSRVLFVSAYPPTRAMTGCSVGQVVRTAAVKAGLAPASPHRLRHTAATEMLRAGATLGEVGQVLRHSNGANTSLYAKVDHHALRTLAVAWPAGAR